MQRDTFYNNWTLGQTFHQTTGLEDGGVMYF